MLITVRSSLEIYNLFLGKVLFRSHFILILEPIPYQITKNAWTFSFTSNGNRIPQFWA